MSYAKKHKVFLNYLSRCGSAQRRHLLKGATRSEINSICEVCSNAIRGRIPLKPHQKAKLRRYRDRLHKLTNKRTPLARKRVILQRGAGFLAPLLAIAAPIISSLL